MNCAEVGELSGVGKLQGLVNAGVSELCRGWWTVQGLVNCQGLVNAGVVNCAGFGELSGVGELCRGRLGTTPKK